MDDFNLDELADVAVADYGDNSLVVLPNATIPPFSFDVNGSGVPDECEGGDFNGDGQTTPEDIDAFVQALFGEPCGVLGDLNGDGEVNGLDITLFIQLLLGE